MYGTTALRRQILNSVAPSGESIAMLHAAGLRCVWRAVVAIGCLTATTGAMLQAADVAARADAARESTYGADAIVSRGFLFEALPTPSCHASTIAEAAPGDFVAAWLGGTREGDPDVGIWTSRLEAGTWTTPVEVADGVQPDGKRYPCWNPVLFQKPAGELLLFSKVGPSPRDWWGLVRSSSDGGLTWGEMTLTDLPNPNSGTDAVTLADGRHLLIYNHTEKGRSPLNVAVSTDGKAWTPVVVLETDPGEYSYPAIIQAADGMVHVTYTWNRRKIAHAVLDPTKFAATKLAAAATPPVTRVPGVVIDHVPAHTQQFVGSPTIAILPDGTYVAAHDFFGPKTAEWKAAITDVFSSADRGATWTKISRVEGAFWSNLFVHDAALYLMGPTKHHGPLVIRRSRDGGRTWTHPADAKTGLLAEGQFHTAPMPVLVHGGRLWRAVEDASGGKEWGKRYMAMMASVPADADLLDRGNWMFSSAIPRNASWLDGKFTGWLEGNAVATADGRVLDILRVEAGSIEKAAVVSISPDGKTASFDPASGFIDLPGAATKFTIRRDPRTEAAGAKPVWWMLSNAAPPGVAVKKDWSRLRNTLGLLKSEDLVTWELRSILLHHPERQRHGFQYVDWLFDGDDVVVVSRTAFDDAEGGARNYHDANYLTFHRVKDFRSRSMADSCVDPKGLGW